MSDRETEELTPDESRVRQALCGLERPRAEASFRERLMMEFVSGAVADRGPSERPIGAHPPSAHPPHTVRVRWPRPVARPALGWTSALAAAAAIAIVVGVVNAPPRWVALPSGGTGSLVVDGVAVPVSQTAEITRRIRPGSRVRLECVRDLDIVSQGVLAMQLASGTEVVLPRAPGRWFGRATRASVQAGHFRITTGERFRGARLAIATPDAAVEVSGTTLAVIAEPTGTCVCVLEGMAKVGRHGGAMMPVLACSRCDVHRDGREPTMGEMRASERPKLADLRDRMRSVLR